MGGQGSPQEPGAENGPAKTLGSSMNRRAVTPAASRFVFWVAFFAVLAVLGPGSVALRADAGKDYYKRGQAAEATEDYDAAYLNYQRAYAASPKNLNYRASLYRVRLSASAMHVTKGRKLVNSGDEQGALVEFLRAAEIDPGNEAAQQEIVKVRNRYVQQAQTQSQTSAANLPATSGQQASIEAMASPTELRPMSSEPLTLHMVEDSKVVYQAVGKAAGVNVLFDPDYIGKRIQVDLNNVSLMDALRIVGTLSGTFWRPVTGNTIFVAANTRAKRTEMEEQAVQTFYLTNAWQANDLNDVQTALRNVLPSAKVYGVASQNAIVMRATPDELLLAQKLINDLDKARPEVVVDISVLEVAKNWEQNLGIAWPQSVGVTLQSSSSTTSTTGTSTTTTGTTTTSTPTIYDLAHLKASDFAVTIGTATANMLLNDSNTRILQNPRIRSTDAQKATLKIGQRIPIATGSFQSGVGVAAAISPMAETQFQYIDVGVNIDMTPTVHYDGDVTLKMKIDVSSQSGSVTISGVTEPIIAQKTSEQTIRLREGEASILGGILNQQEQENWTGIPGLSSIPILKYLFGSKDHIKTDDEIVFLLVPHIVRSPILTPVNLRSIDTGVGQAIDLRHVSTQGAGPAVITPIPPARPMAAAPITGTVPGQTAEAAGPAALAQMRAAAQATETAAAPAPQQAPAAAPQTTALPPQGLNFSLVAPHDPVAAGATFQVPVVIAGAADIAAVPLQIQYDAAKLSLVNVDNGDFLGRSGQAVALVHRDDGPGNITLNASLPPGAPGVSGAGVVCMLTFQAKAPGAAAIAITRPGAMTSAQKPVQAQGAQTTVVVK
ncbi:MAG: type II and III secretion system protein [Acidobacteriota bacterium]|nr:type II and III secretion system protein [Acidobacteriota bacterium]